MNDTYIYKYKVTKIVKGYFTNPYYQTWSHLKNLFYLTNTHTFISIRTYLCLRRFIHVARIKFIQFHIFDIIQYGCSENAEVF